MIFLPLCLNIQNRRILVVGGGNVAAQKLSTLCLYGADITVAAPEIGEAVRRFPVRTVERAYSDGLLDGMGLVFACTDDRELNRRIGEAARQRGILVNVADDPAFCDFISPAVYKEGDMSVAVSSNARDVRRSVAWRNEIRKIAQERLLDREDAKESNNNDCFDFHLLAGR